MSVYRQPLLFLHLYPAGVGCAYYSPFCCLFSGVDQQQQLSARFQSSFSFLLGREPKCSTSCSAKSLIFRVSPLLSSVSVSSNCCCYICRECKLNCSRKFWYLEQLHLVGSVFRETATGSFGVRIKEGRFFFFFLECR